MRKSKGFTLVELLGIIAIIGAVLAFVTPSIIGMLKKDDEKEYQRFLNDIFLATETYVGLHIENYPELSNIGGTSTISMNDLIENGYVKTTMINPKTKERIHPSDQITIKIETDGSYQYAYIATE